MTCMMLCMEKQTVWFVLSCMRTHWLTRDAGNLESPSLDGAMGHEYHCLILISSSSELTSQNYSLAVAHKSTHACLAEVEVA